MTDRTKLAVAAAERMMAQARKGASRLTEDDIEIMLAGEFMLDRIERGIVSKYLENMRRSAR